MDIVAGLQAQIGSGLSAVRGGLRWSDAPLLVVVGFGLFGIFDLPGPAWLVALGAVALGALVALSIRGVGWRPATAVLRVLTALLVALLALVGFDVVLNGALKLVHLNPPWEHLRIPVWVGLILAMAVFAAAAGWYLHRLRFPTCAAFSSGFGLAFVAILVTPLVVGALKADDTTPVSRPGPVPSRLEMLIVTDGRHHPPPPALERTPALGEFTVRYSVGVASGDGVRWTLVDGDSEAEALLAASEGSQRATAPSRPAAATGSDSVLALLVDGTDPLVESPAELPDRRARPGEVRRWQRIAAAAAPGAPTFALLQTTDPTRLRHWQAWRPGRVVSVQALESQAVTDAALRLAVAAPESRAQYLLAMRYRPVLLFDHTEEVPWPLSIAGMFAQGRVRLCRDEGLRTTCPSEPIRNPDELENGATSLRLDLPSHRQLQALAREELRRVEAGAAPALPRRVEASVPEGTPAAGTAEPPVRAGEEPASTGEEGAPAPPGAGSTTIYVHPVAAGARLLYLDYWWYLPDNPVRLGGGALCGAGLVIAGVTCDNHQSDWEGMTVELLRAGPEPRPVALLYAQHDSVIRYGWGALRRQWKQRLPPRVREELDAIGDTDGRPLAFVASGTHATYPLPCGDCGQLKNWALGEEPHRGDLPWAGDYSNACGDSSCLQLLPTRARGTEPASWNAYDHPWGELDCFLVYYCDSGTPPRSPAEQRRYRHPAGYDANVDSEGRLHRVARGA